MKFEEKKEYLTPAMTVVNVNAESSLLTASVGNPITEEEDWTV